MTNVDEQNGRDARLKPETDALDEQQRSGVGDMDPEEFRAAAHAAVDIMADYLAGVGERDVMPAVEPGSLRPLFPAAPPESPEAIETILADYRRLIEPNAVADEPGRHRARRGCRRLAAPGARTAGGV